MLIIIYSFLRTIDGPAFMKIRAAWWHYWYEWSLDQKRDESGPAPFELTPWAGICLNWSGPDANLFRCHSANLSISRYAQKNFSHAILNQGRHPITQCHIQHFDCASA